MPGFRRNLRTRSRVKIEIPSRAIKPLVITATSVIIICIAILGVKEVNHNIEIAKKQEQIDSIIYNLFEEEDYENVELLDIEFPDKVINIVSTGDILCETGILEDAYNEETGTYEFSQMFTDVKQYIQDADITLASVETNFVEGEEYSGRLQYNAPLTLLNTIKDLGIDIINTANNHSLDYGFRGIESTINNIQKVGLENVGTYKTEEDSSKILVKEIKGIKIAFLAYTYGITSNPKNLQEAPYALNITEKEKMIADIKESKDQGADFTFVLMHWGDVESSVQNNEQKELADFLFQNGADFIFGTHPASIQPMEVRENNQEKNIFIAYSTGNLISSREYKNSNVEMILNIEITKDAKTGDTRLSKVTYTPVYLLDRGEKAEDRYKLLDVKKEIENYENRIKKYISKEEYEKCLQALIDIDRLIGKNKE